MLMSLTLLEVHSSCATKQLLLPGPHIALLVAEGCMPASSPRECLGCGYMCTIVTAAQSLSQHQAVTHSCA